MLHKVNVRGDLFVVELRRVKEEEDEQFGYDPFWDDDDDDDWNIVIPDDPDEDKGLYFHSSPEAVPSDDDLVTEQSKAWVKSMMSDMGLCPFTSGDQMAGLPMGKVRYEVDRAKTVEAVYEQYWREVALLDESNYKEVSTTLLIVPEFCMGGNYGVDFFESFSSTLSGTLEGGLNMEDLIQLVFFHPEWTFRDGGARSDEDGGTFNYARRSPYPMINLLRTDQVRRGQRSIPTGLVYTQNGNTLREIGGNRLEDMLRNRDWVSLEGMKVDRSMYEALDVARGLQMKAETDGIDAVEKVGEVEIDYNSEIKEANKNRLKEDRSNIEGGDLVNVLLQVLQILRDGGKLNGSQRAVAVTAIGFILEDDSL